MAKSKAVPFKLTAGHKLLLEMKYQEKWIERRTRRPYQPEHVLCGLERGNDDVWTTVVQRRLNDASVTALANAGWIVGRPADTLWDLVRFELTDAGEKESERARNEEARHAR